MNTDRTAELKDISKVFASPPDSEGTVTPFAALDGVTLAFRPSEIHTILGENGAGKSTLVHILSGLHQPTAGSIRIGGQEYSFSSPSQALSAGIAMVHQRPLLSDELSVLENILVGSSGVLLHRAARSRAISELAARWGMKLDLSAHARTLTAADRLRTALLGALYRHPDFLILDEPSTVLAPAERESFFRSLEAARDGGLGIILITHRIDEAVRWADRISVLRRGRLVFTAATRPTTGAEPVSEDLLAALLDPEGLSRPRPKAVAAEGAQEAPPGRAPDGKPREGAAGLVVTELSARPANRNPVGPLSFTAGTGEITGIYGLPGSGLETLEDLLTGMLRPDRGSVAAGQASLGPEDIGPGALRRNGIACVPSDRNFRGSHPDLTVFDLLAVYRARRFFRDIRGEERFVRTLLGNEQIEASPARPARTLSGGQLQRLILARELAPAPRILILAEPEWGLDIRSTALLRQRLLEAAAAGMAILILTDNPETAAGGNFFTRLLVLEGGRFA